MLHITSRDELKLILLDLAIYLVVIIVLVAYIADVFELSSFFYLASIYIIVTDVSNVPRWTFLTVDIVLADLGSQSRGLIGRPSDNFGHPRRRCGC